MKIQQLSESVVRDKETWNGIGRRILAFYGCDETPAGIGTCIDKWRSDHRVPEDEIINGLGFLLGDLTIDLHGGEWRWVVDDFGETPAVQRIEDGYVAYVLDWVSKRLTGDASAEREIPSIVDVYGRL